MLADRLGLRFIAQDSSAGQRRLPRGHDHSRREDPEAPDPSSSESDESPPPSIHHIQAAGGSLVVGTRRVGFLGAPPEGPLVGQGLARW